MKTSNVISIVKANKGLISNGRGLPGRHEGVDGSTTVRSQGKYIYLCYKLKGRWYYSILNPYTKSKVTDRTIITRRSPISYGEIFFKTTTPYINFQTNKEIILNDDNVEIKSKSLYLDGDKNTAVSSYNEIEDFNSQDGVALHIDTSVATDTYTETAGTASDFNYAVIEGPTLAASSASVITTSASTLKLGVPAAGDNQTITNAYALNLSGNIKSKHLTINDGGNITLDALGHIALDVNDASDCIDFMIDGTTFATIDTTASTSRFTLFENAGATVIDHFRIDCSAAGVTNIQTTDGAGTDADLTIRADGDLILDSNNGVFIARINGTQFSATDSAYAGMILGHTYIAPATTDRWTFTTSWEAVTSGGTASYAPKVSFVFPPSGNVMITCALGSQCSGLSGNLYMGLATDASATTLHSRYEHSLLDVDETDTVNPRHSWTISGGTPGDAEEIWIMCKTASGTGRVNFGGGLGAIQVWATALPATIYDGT